MEREIGIIRIKIHFRVAQVIIVNSDYSFFVFAQVKSP